MWRAERRSGALEYLLTFPEGRGRLLFRKMAVRLGVVLPFWLIFAILSHLYLRDPRLDGFLFPLNHPVFMHLTFLFMMGCGFLLSLHEQKNWGAVVSLLLLYDIVLLTLAFSGVLKHWGIWDGQPLLQRGLGYTAAVLSCLLMLFLPFMSQMRSLDLRTFSQQNILRLKTVPLLGAGLVGSLLGLIHL